VSDEIDSSAERLDRSAFDLVFSDDFSRAALDRDRWIDHYLPHWSTAERTAARYVLGGNGLGLLIEANQLEWRPEEGPMRVSNVQTSSLSGPLEPGYSCGTGLARLAAPRAQLALPLRSVDEREDPF
jgi:hypothetical protein